MDCSDRFLGSALVMVLQVELSAKKEGNILKVVIFLDSVGV